MTMLHYFVFGPAFAAVEDAGQALRMRGGSGSGRGVRPRVAGEGYARWGAAAGRTGGGYGGGG